MASSSSGPTHLGMTENQKHWLVTGIALNKILIPQIRPFVEQGIKTEYNNLKTSYNIDTQTTYRHLTPKWLQGLKYENINGNDGHPKLPGRRFNYSLFDCRVTSHCDFARLYVQNHMAHFTAFDDHCDASAVLTLLGRVPVFSAVKSTADYVRETRNDWAHCVFGKWDQTKFLSSFTEMKQLVKAIALPPSDEKKLLEELKDWETKGTHLCMNSPLDPALIQLVQQELKSLQDDVKNMSVEYDKERAKVESELQNCGSCLEELRQRVERLETGQQNIEKTVDELKARLGFVEDQISEGEGRLRMWIDCEITGSHVEPRQVSQADAQGTTTAPNVSGQAQAEAAEAAGVASSATHGLPSPQDVLSLIALECFQAIDPSKQEELNGFLRYMKKEHKVVIVDVQLGSLIMTVECGSLEILEGLWKDYKTGLLNEMAQKYLVTEDILKKLGNAGVKLTTEFLEEEYTACKEHFMPSFGLLRLIIKCLAITAKTDLRRGSSELGGVSYGVYPTTEDVLNLAAEKYLKTIDPSKPEDFNGFVDFLVNLKNVLIVRTEQGSLIITVKCRSQQILQELWNDYCSGLVNEMAQKFLVTKDVLNELNLTEAKLTTTIPDEDYRSCQEQILLYSVKNQRNEFQYQFLHWARSRKRTRALLTELKTWLRRLPWWFILSSELHFALGNFLGLVAATTAAASAGANRLPTANKIYEVHQAIDKDKMEGQKLKAMIEEDALGKCVADFAFFCRKHIDSVMSSELAEGEFRFLFDILRGTRSHGAATIGEVPRPALLDEERANNLLEQLESSEADDEASTITQAILDELQECPSEEEIQRRIMNFMETKFAEACSSQL